MTDLTHLARALAVRALAREGRPDELFAAAIQRLRADACEGVHDDKLNLDGAQRTYDQIMELTPADMPPSGALLRTLIETVSQRHDALTTDSVWQSIGYARGYGYEMARGLGRRGLSWRAWCRLRAAAFGPVSKRRAARVRRLHRQRTRRREQWADARRSDVPWRCNGDRWLGFWRDGQSVSDIARTTGYTKASVSAALLSRGARTREPIDWDRGRQLYAAGCNDAEIGRQLGCGRRAVFEWRRREGLPTMWGQGGTTRD